MTTALLFPGQGSQRVGMGRDLAHRFDVARRTYDEADAALGFAISALCFDGPEDALTLTQHSQPAILATSMAVFRVLGAEKGLRFDAVAGHSLGEWTALAAAGALDFADAVRLVHLRGQFMQDAVPVGVGAMAALMGLDLAATRALCAEASAPGEPVRARELERRRPDRDLRPRRRDRSRARRRQGQGRQARHEAAGQRAVPLLADGSRPRIASPRRWPTSRSSRRRCRSTPT
jgi:acyl transferase domain-containing protein